VKTRYIYIYTYVHKLRKIRIIAQYYYGLAITRNFRQLDSSLRYWRTFDEIFIIFFNGLIVFLFFTLIEGIAFPFIYTPGWCISRRNTCMRRRIRRNSRQAIRNVHLKCERTHIYTVYGTRAFRRRNKNCFAVYGTTLAVKITYKHLTKLQTTRRKKKRTNLYYSVSETRR